MVLSYPRPGQLEQWKNIPLRQRIEQEFGVPVLLEDSVRAVATMENFMGAGRSFSDFVYVDVGVGIGAAIFIGGSLYRGHGGSAGEFGHITVDEDGPLCCCGSSGCLEAVASGATMIESMKIALRRGVSSKITEKDDFDLDKITIEMIAAAAEENDSLSYRILSEAAAHIGAAAADLVNLLNPAALIFGGAVSRAVPTILIERIRATIRHRALEKSANDVQIQASILEGDAGARGAARLIAARLIERIYFDTACREGVRS
jgi:predicted NBD/HSP70 family sugar kinase